MSAPIEPSSVSTSSPPLPAPTFADRQQATEAGFLRGAAYLATSLPDAVANAQNLERAGLGTLISFARSSQEQSTLRTPGGLYHYMTPEGIERLSKDPPPPGATPVMLQHPGAIPSWLEATDGVSPVGGALTSLMDRSAITTTQPVRPDDPVSRYLSIAGSV